MINEKFGERFLATVNATGDNPVQLLFNQWWSEAPDDVEQQYLDIFLGDEEMFDEQLVDVRERFGITPSPMAARQAAATTQRGN